MRTWEEGDGSTRVRLSGFETPEERLRLERTADVLRRLAHPGLIAGEVAGGGDSLRLRVQWVGPTLETLLGELAAVEVAGIGAAVATTLADLHALGWVHRAVNADHILIDPGGRPVLCGLSRTEPRSDDAACLGDVAALVATLRSALLHCADGDVDRVSKALRVRGRDVTDAALLARRLAHPALGARLPRLDRIRGETHSSDDELPAEGARTPFFVLASPNSDEAVEGRATPGSVPAVDSPVSIRRSWSVWRGAAVSLAVLGVVVAALDLTGSAGAQVAKAGPGGAVCPPVDSGCRPLHLVGGVLATAAGQFRLGGGGPVVLGRWECGPVALPATLDLASGQVWVFDRWPTPGVDVAARSIGSIIGAESITVVPGRDGCDTLDIIRDGKTAIPLDPAASGSGQPEAIQPSHPSAQPEPGGNPHGGGAG